MQSTPDTHPSLNELAAIATRAERVTGRRLAKSQCISEAAALRATLCAVAAPRELSDLIAERSAAKLKNAQTKNSRRLEKFALYEAKKAANRVPANHWQAWFDGSTHPNPGECSIGCVLMSPEGLRFTHAARIGYGSSSDAEYGALIRVLAMAAAHQAQHLTVYGDSQVVIGDALSDDVAASPILKNHRLQAQAFMRQFSQLSLRWIPRHKNAEADALSQQAQGARQTDRQVPAD
ncbi:MAG: ribonuclease HI family protein [Burkholderiales bacterium]|nr:ribonuclease HI family protein [Burkholderiales bacterium]